MSEPLRCVVCETAVDPAAEACPKCSEPRVRICTCTTLVTLDQRACPSCNRVLPRVLSMGRRAQRKRKRLLVAGTVAVVVLGGAAAAVWPLVSDARRASSLRESAFAAVAAGDTARAAQQLAEYVLLRPADAEARGALAKVYLDRGESAAGIAEAQRALAIDEAAPGVHLAVAKHLLAHGDPLGALAQVGAAKEPEGKAVVARALAALERRVDAAQAFDAAIAATPGDLALRADAAALRSELSRADWPQADDNRRRAAEIAESVFRDAAQAIARGGAEASAAAPALAAAVAAHPALDAAKVASLTSSALEVGGDNPAVRVAAARALLAAGDRAAAARAIGRAPSGAIDPALRLERARVLRDCDRAPEANDELRDVLQADPANEGAAVAAARLRLDARSPADAMGFLVGVRSAGAAESPLLLEALTDAALATGDAARAERHLLAWAAAAPADPRPLRRLVDLTMPKAERHRLATVDADGPTRAAVAHLEALGALDSDDRTFLRWRTRWDALSGREAESAARFARLLAVHADDPATRELRMERAFAGTGERPEAIAAAWRAGGEQPRTDLHAFLHAATHHDAYALALDVAADALARRPDDAETVAHVARALLATGRPAAAASAIDAAPDAVRSDPAVAELRDFAAALAGDVPTAADVAPADADVARLCRAARVMSLAGRTDDADALFRRARAAAGATSAALVQVAEAIEDAGRFDEATRVWDAAEVTAAGDVVILARGVEARLARGAGTTPDDRSAAAARLVVVRAHAAGEIETIALRGAFSAVGGDPRAGIEDLRRALRALPERSDLRILLAEAYAAAGRTADAVSEARRALVQRPASLPARRALAMALAESAASKASAGELLAALRALEDLSALAGGPSDPSPQPAAGLRDARLPPESLAWVKAAAASDDDGQGARLVLAICDAARGSHDAAEAAATAIVTARPDLPGGHVVRAFVRALAGRTAEAETDAANAAGVNAPGADVAFVRALAAGRGGDAARAVSILDQWSGAGMAPRTRAAFAEIAVRSDATRARALDVFTELLETAPDEADRMDLHAWGAALADGAEAGSARAAVARRTLLRALLVAPAAPAAAASRRILASLG